MMGDDSYSDVEARRQQWITYYVASGQFEEARKLGWVGCAGVGSDVVASPGDETTNIPTLGVGGTADVGASDGDDMAGVKGPSLEQMTRDLTREQAKEAEQREVCDASPTLLLFF